MLRWNGSVKGRFQSRGEDREDSWKEVLSFHISSEKGAVSHLAIGLSWSDRREVVVILFHIAVEKVARATTSTREDIFPWGRKRTHTVYAGTIFVRLFRSISLPWGEILMGLWPFESPYVGPGWEGVEALLADKHVSRVFRLPTLLALYVFL